MNNYCKKCRLRDGCLQKCKEAEVYEQGYNDAYDDIGRVLRLYKKKKKQWHTTKRPLSESIVGSGVETNSISRVAETTALANGASENATDKI